jgi:nucleotide-binding universal stress UspA family protein
MSQLLTSRAPLDEEAQTTTNEIGSAEHHDASPLRRILLAAGGTASCESAVRTTAALAAMHGSRVSVVSVFHPRIPYPAVPGRHAPPSISQSDRLGADRQLAEVQRMLSAAGHASEVWSLTLVAGHIAQRVRESAAADHADLVVIGMGREHVTDRRLGDRAAMAIAASVRAPLLAAAPGFIGAPKRLLIAVGSDTATIDAARSVARMLPAPERVFLVHVVPEHAYADDPAVAEQLAAVRHELARWTTSTVIASVLVGDPIERVLAFSREHGVDLIVGGLHGNTYDERAIIRNVALWLMADGECSVLLVPSVHRASVNA